MKKNLTMTLKYRHRKLDEFYHLKEWTEEEIHSLKLKLKEYKNQIKILESKLGII